VWHAELRPSFQMDDFAVSSDGNTLVEELTGKENGKELTDK